MFCVSVDVFKIFEDKDYGKIFEVLSTLKNKKLKVNNILIEKYKDKFENADFKQNRYSITSTGVYKIAHDSISLIKWICYYDRSYYENINYYYLMGSICKYLDLNEISEQ